MLNYKKIVIKKKGGGDLGFWMRREGRENDMRTVGSLVPWAWKFFKLGKSKDLMIPSPF